MVGKEFLLEGEKDGHIKDSETLFAYIDVSLVHVEKLLSSLQALSGLQFLLNRIRVLQETVSKFPLSSKTLRFGKHEFFSGCSTDFFNSPLFFGSKMNWNQFFSWYPRGKSWSLSLGLPCLMKFKVNLRLMPGRYVSFITITLFVPNFCPLGCPKMLVHFKKSKHKTC